MNDNDALDVIGEVRRYQRASIGLRLGGWIIALILRPLTLWVGYFIWSFALWSKGKTPAKEILNMRVVSTETGEIASRKLMALRQLGIPLAYLGAALILSGLEIAFTAGKTEGGMVSVIRTITSLGYYLISILWVFDRLWIFKGSNRSRLTDLVLKTTVIRDPK